MSKAESSTDASRQIDQKIRELTDWRGAALMRVRETILSTDPGIVEEIKWRGVPVWSHSGSIICTGETYARAVKLTFARGASLPDPAGLFNSSLEGNTRRAIDIQDGQTLATAAFKTLIRAAIDVNKARAKPAKPAAKTQKLTARPATDSARPAKKSTKPATKSPEPASKSARPVSKSSGPPAKVKLLSGGNPQIAKADGDAAVQAYIAAMPGWKQAVGRRLDDLISQAVPGVRRAVRWNTPFYGIEGDGWFLGFHCITKYVKVAFFRGAALRPMPPGESKQKQVRYLDIYQDDQTTDQQLLSWIRQASKLPGEPVF